MDVVRRALRGATVAGAVVAGLVAIASAPAASAPGAPSFLSAATARGQPLRTVESSPAAGWGSSGLRARKGSVTAGAIFGVREAGDMSGGLVRVVVEAENLAAARAGVAAVGGRFERAAGGLVQALVRPSSVHALGTRPGVEDVRAPAVPIELAVAGEEVAASLASRWHAAGLRGNGVKVAVVDAGFAGLAQRQAEGELPANAVTHDLCGGELATESEHGTAVAEVVHEVAPEAQLHLVCVDTEVDVAAAVAYAKSEGVRVVNHSIGWEGPFRSDGSSPVGAAVADARANGILWVNAAGNEAQTHWSGTYRDRGGIHDWDGSGDVGNSFVWPDGTAICGFLKWEEWPHGVSDFDLGLFLSGANVLLASSELYQTGSQSPYEEVCVVQSSGYDLEVFWAIRGWQVTTSPRLDLTSWSPPLQHQVAAGSIAEPATSPAALAVGALCWQSRELEPYSSQGPTVDGRVKPELVGHDAVSSATYGAFDACPAGGGRSGFAGTSASAPEVAGAAALVGQAYPSFGPDQIRDFLLKAARDLGPPGPDNAYGAGELQLPAPPDVLAPSAKALPSTGRKGTTVRLLSTVFDDLGQVSVVEKVLLGSRTVATIRRPGYVTASSPRTVAVTWKAPSAARGAYRHCVQAVDRAGNRSAPSCARIVLR